MDISIKNSMLLDIFNALQANTTDERILDFSDVRKGWLFGEGEAISSVAIRDAMKLHDVLLSNGFYETDAFPGLSGEVRVTAYRENEYLEFTRETDGSWTYIFERDGETEDDQDSLTLDEASEIISRLANTWNTSVSCRGDFGINDWVGSRVWHSDHPVTEESRLSNVIASYPKVTPYVVISENFTPQPGSHQYTGYLMIPYFQTPPASSFPQVIRGTGATGTLQGYPAKRLNQFSKITSSSPIWRSVTAKNQEDLRCQTCHRD